MQPIIRRVFESGIGLEGLNQLTNTDFLSADIPWRIATVDARDCKIDRDFSAEWTLKRGHTAFLSASQQDAEVVIEYAPQGGAALMPVLPGMDYLFEGYFGSHRCTAAVIIECVDRLGRTARTERAPIGPALGGRELGQYSHVTLPIRFDAHVIGIRLKLAIEQFVGDGSARSFLFFTNLGFGCRTVGESSGWRKSPLTPVQQEELSRGAALIEYLLPHWTSRSACDVWLDISSTGQSGAVEGAPLVLPASPPLSFDLHSFNGFALSGTLHGLEEAGTLELLIDGSIARHYRVEPQGGATEADVTLRVPNDHLDGEPHLVELREAGSGFGLLTLAEILPALVTPWDVLEEHSRTPLPFHMQPLARERHRNLGLRVKSLAELPEDATAEQIRAALAWTKLYSDCVLGTTETSPATNQVEIPEVEAPKVSIVIHGARSADIVRRCITSILVASTHLSFEIMVVDDMSIDLADRLVNMSGIRFISVPSLTVPELLNQAVTEARGEFVALLDALVEPFAGWLDELTSAFDLFDDVAIAGAKIVGAAGRLRTMGRLLSRSGDLHEARFGTNAEHPRNSYARQVDGLSSAAVLLRRNLYLACGGLSPFSTRDLTDFDLALSVTAQGGKAIVVPTSLVCLHDEPRLAYRPPSGAVGQSTDPKFRRKWRDRFKRHGVPGKPTTRDVDRNADLRVLFADLQVPRADVDGGGYAAIQEIRLLQALGFKVTFLSMNLMHLGVYTRALQRIGVEVIYAPFVTTVEEAVAERAGEFDVIYITRYNVAKVLLPTVRKHNPGAKVVLNVADLHFLRELRAALAADKPEAIRRSKVTRDAELEVLRQVDLALTYNDVEQGIIVSHTFESEKVAKAPWVAKPQETVPPHESRKNIAFVGSFGHHPNGEAVSFFAEEVMPLVAGTLPDMNFLIYGSQMTPAVRALTSPRVQVIGHVDDLASVYNQVLAVVAPLQSGAGIKAKVLGAMASGVPTVLSPIAAEGIGARRGVDYLGAQTPEEWVKAIHTLASDPRIWQRISQSALDLVRENYSFERGVEMMRSALEAVDIFTPNAPQALCCRVHLPPLV